MMTQRLDIVNFLRGFAITTIVVMHLLYRADFSGLLEKAVNFGGAGVHAFFLVSGFGLYLSHLRKPLTYPAFLKHRFLRVYLPFAIVILVSAAVPFYYTAPDKLTAVASNLLLFKMFSEHFESSFGGQMWFVSTIIQFYLCWQLIVKIFKQTGGGKRSFLLALFISLGWSTFVALSGLSEQRIWGSFFLQYLWEFVLGMILASVYNLSPEKILVPSLRILFPFCFGGVILTGLMGSAGGIWKSFNDIPSLVGYLSMALIVYRLCGFRIRSFFSFTNKFGYEWYLVHILVFAVVFHYLGSFPFAVVALMALLSSYVVAWAYDWALRKIKVK